MTVLGDIQVLIVDDNRQMRVLLRALLRAAGIAKIAEAASAVEAFEALNEAPVDLLLVDWKMQPIDGLVFTKMVRQGEDSANPYVPILMMTAHTEVSRVAAARDAGVTGFIKKPISARVLFDRISNALIDTRPFVRAQDYFGPDRRRGQLASFSGPFRRASDRVGEMVDLDDVRWRA